MTRAASLSRTASSPAGFTLWWNVGYILVAAAIATGLAWPIYATERMLVVAAVATVAGLGLVMLARWLRWGVLTTLGVGVAFYLITVVPLAIPSALTSPLRILRGVGDGVLGVVVGWKQLLTLTLPVADYQAVLVPFFVLMFVGTAVATWCVFSTGWRQMLVTPTAAALCLFGLIFGSSAADAPVRVGPLLVPAPREVLLSLAFVVLTMLWVAGRARQRRARALRAAQASSEGVRQRRVRNQWVGIRRSLLGVALVLVAVLAGLTIAPAAATWAPRTALRDAVDPVVVVQQQSSPLSGYRNWFDDDLFSTELFTVAGDAGQVDRMRVAALGHFDGEVFRPGADGARSVEGSSRAAGSAGAVGSASSAGSAGSAGFAGDPLRFTRMPEGRAGADSVELSVRIGEGLAGVWVPMPRPVLSAPRFSGGDAEMLADTFYVNRADDSAVVVADRDGGTVGLRPGDAYTVVASTATDAAELGTPRAVGSVDAELLPALAEWVELQAVPHSAAGLVDALDRLRSRGYLSHGVTAASPQPLWVSDVAGRAPYRFLASYSGHSAARVDELFASLVEQERMAGPDASAELLVAAVGDDEQFAAAAALLARYLGFDSRVVVGAKLVDTDPNPAVLPCEGGVCRGGNMTAWVEVAGSDGVWVTLDASPQVSVAPSTVTEGEQLPENATIPSQEHSQVVEPPPAQRDDADAPPEPEQEGAAWWAVVLPILWAIGTGVLLVVLLVLPFVVVLLMKRWRTRQRRDATDPEVAVVGAWAELMDAYTDGGIAVPSGVSRSVVAERVGRPRAAELAARVDAAVFAEHPPSAAVADEVWMRVAEEKAELRQLGSLLQRVRAKVSVRSFVRPLSFSRAWDAFRAHADRKKAK